MCVCTYAHICGKRKGFIGCFFMKISNELGNSPLFTPHYLTSSTI